jgi:serine/threonine protein kinase
MVYAPKPIVTPMYGGDRAVCVQLAPGLDDQGLDLLAAMFEYDPTRRITAEEALAHPWFEDVRLPM